MKWEIWKPVGITPPLITELTCSVPADARKKTTPEMK